MVDFRYAVDLHGFADPRTPRPQSMDAELLAPGVVHVDHHDAGHVFRVTVEQVPRRQLPVGDALVGHLGEVAVHVTQLVVDNHVTVRLEGRGPAADAEDAERRRRYDDWVATCRSRSDPPPAWPAERLQDAVQIALSDDVGTEYRAASGQAGGDDAPWEALRRYLPAPPATAAELQVHLRIEGQPDAHLRVPLSHP